jgi:hypothetical protein
MKALNNVVFSITLFGGDVVMAETVRDPNGELNQIIEKVSESNTPINVRNVNGNEVKVIPVPKPIGYRGKIPIYRPEDLKYLYLDHPYWFDM